MVTLLGLAFICIQPQGIGTAGRATATLKPVVITRGKQHRLAQTECYLVNSSDQAAKVFARSLPSDSLLCAPDVDYERYSLICLFAKRRPLLSSLRLARIEESRNTLIVKYREESITQVFFGLNDDVAEAPYLLIIIPKWSGRAVYYSATSSTSTQPRWTFEGRTP